jgi:hypothetical protein
MSSHRWRDRKLPDAPLPDSVVKTSLISALTILVAVTFFILLTGFARVVPLPIGIVDPSGSVSVAVCPQGGSQTPDLSDQGATGPQGLLGSVLAVGPAGPKGDTGATGSSRGDARKRCAVIIATSHQYRV